MLFEMSGHDKLTSLKKQRQWSEIKLVACLFVYSQPFPNGLYMP